MHIPLMLVKQYLGKTMKRTIVILSSILMLVSCGNENSTSASDSSNKPTSNNKPAQKAEKLLACSVLSKDFIQSKYASAEITMLKEGGRTYPLCSARFKFENSEYDVSLTLGVIGEADESYLESSISYFKEKGRIEKISGVGDEAYNRTGGADQISALKNGNLIHVSTYKNNKYDLEMAKKMTNDLFSELEK